MCSAIRSTLGQRQIRQSPGLALNSSGNDWGLANSSADWVNCQMLFQSHLEFWIMFKFATALWVNRLIYRPTYSRLSHQLRVASLSAIITISNIMREEARYSNPNVLETHVSTVILQDYLWHRAVETHFKKPKLFRFFLN